MPIMSSQLVLSTMRVVRAYVLVALSPHELVMSTEWVAVPEQRLLSCEPTVPPRATDKLARQPVGDSAPAPLPQRAAAYQHKLEVSGSPPPDVCWSSGEYARLLAHAQEWPNNHFSRRGVSLRMSFAVAGDGDNKILWRHLESNPERTVYHIWQQVISEITLTVARLHYRCGGIY